MYKCRELFKGKQRETTYAQRDKQVGSTDDLQTKGQMDT